ncbi:hypothetical protein [Pontibacter kalidii]|uniref:hypothetical protein n=1 Tax=Pontibacter kalidii TaxID=2592049 RepID=UPI002253676A|nr:hypothetical protein [Pontibacter kalidii]
MDLTTIVIGCLALAVFIVPIMYLQRKQKEKTGKASAEFLAMGEQQQVRLAKYELWNDRYGIGLDEEQKKLFYLRKDDAQEQKLLLNLADFKKSSVSSASRDVNGTKVFDLIELRLTSRNAKHSELRLEVYDKEVSIMLSGELQLAEKWNTLINASIAAATPADLASEKAVSA